MRCLLCESKSSILYNKICPKCRIMLSGAREEIRRYKAGKKKFRTWKEFWESQKGDKNETI